jgi:hypothetical protein
MGSCAIDGCAKEVKAATPSVAMNDTDRIFIPPCDFFAFDLFF